MNAYTILETNSRTIGFVIEASSADEALEKAYAGKIVMARGVKIDDGEVFTARKYRPGVDRR